MICKNLNSLLLAGGVLVSPIPQGLAHPLGMAPGSEQPITPVQGPPGPPPGAPGGLPPGGPSPMPGPPGPPGLDPAQVQFQHCATLQQEAAAIQGELPN